MADAEGLRWDDLRLFLAIAEQGSLSRAAKILGTTQPTVSRRLAELEEAVGTPLFERTSGGARPTDRGRAMMDYVVQMARAAEGVEQIARTETRDIAGRVTVACGPLIGRQIALRAPKLLAPFPELELEVVTGLKEVRLERGDADIAIRNRRPKSPTMYVRRLTDVRFAVYGSVDYVQDHPEAKDERRYQHCAWIGYDTHHDGAPSARWLQKQLPKPPRLRFSSGLHILAAALGGAGLAVLALGTGEREPRLVRVSAPLDGIGFEGYLVTHARSRGLPRVRVVADALADLLRSSDDQAMDVSQ